MPPPSDGASLDIGIAGHNLVRRDGQGRWMLEIVRHLANAGHRVTVYSFNLEEELRSVPGIVWRRIRPVKGPKLIGTIFLLFVATRALRRASHDVVGVLGPSALPRAPHIYFAAFSQSGWREVWRREGSPPSLYGRLYGWVGLILERKVARRCDALIAMSERTAKEIAPGLRSGVAWSVVPGGVDSAEFQPVGENERAEARRSFGLESEFAVALVGELGTPRKGLEKLVAALEQGPGDEVILARGPGSPEQIQGRLERLGLSATSVRFIGTGPAEPVMAAADVVAIPSLYEPFSIVALEAASRQVPIVISSLAGASPYLIEGAGAQEVDPYDPKTIRAALDRLRADRAAGSEMAKRARAVALKMSWESAGELAVQQVADFARTHAVSSVQRASQ